MQPVPSTYFTARLTDAFDYARGLHANQVRKGTTVPYIAHLLGVAALVIDHGGDEDQAMAALLHDAIEDQGRGGRTRAEIEAKRGQYSSTIGTWASVCGRGSTPGATSSCGTTGISSRRCEARTRPERARALSTSSMTW